MKSNNSEELSKRKEVGFLKITSKKDNFEISSIKIGKYINDNIQYDEKSLNFKKKMLKYFSYEMCGKDNVFLYFNFDFCERDSGIDACKGLLIPYLIEIHIKDTTNDSKKYVLSLFSDRMYPYENSIELKKVDCPGNDDFVVFKPRQLLGLGLSYIVPKNEEDWKKLSLMELKYGRRWMY